MKVARLYRFTASHSLPGVAGYDKPHEHDYTVEVVVEGFIDGSMVIDTSKLDEIASFVFNDWQSQDLNTKVDFSTTVECLADYLLGFFRAIAPGRKVTVRVDEDGERWGQAP